jgi:DNA (cytosine-5)-methyltransferase 1
VSALTTSYCGGIGGVDDNAAQAGYVVVQPQAVNENQRAEVTLTDVTAPLSGGGGKPGQGYPCIVQPLALRGREGGAMLELGPEGGPYNALRAGDGGSSRQSLIAVTSPVAFMHTAGIDIQASASPTIKAGHDTMPSVHTGTVVRRLTELECERLQGYPDDYTDGQSGSARYRQLGNSVAVPAVEWLARRLIAVDEVLA